jgi:hypothetical protein
MKVEKFLLGTVINLLGRIRMVLVAMLKDGRSPKVVMWVKLGFILFPNQLRDFHDS